MNVPSGSPGRILMIAKIITVSPMSVGMARRILRVRYLFKRELQDVEVREP
jgi:hypothetical protein